MVKVNRKIVGDINVPLPSLEEQERIMDFLGGVDSSRIAQTTCLDRLRRLKSALMSVLLTGELRVRPDPEPA